LIVAREGLAFAGEPKWDPQHREHQLRKASREALMNRLLIFGFVPPLWGFTGLVVVLGGFSLDARAIILVVGAAAFAWPYYQLRFSSVLFPAVYREGIRVLDRRLFATSRLIAVPFADVGFSILRPPDSNQAAQPAVTALSKSWHEET
jgi:hypothetical protein